MDVTLASRRRSLAGAALAVLGLVLLTGCLTADSTVKADGSGTMQLTYPPPGGATKASETKRFTADTVSVDALDVASSGKSATVKLTFTDVTKLSSAKALEKLSVTRTKGEGTETLAITLRPDKVTKLKPEQVKDQPPLKIKVTLPGTVKEANAGGTTSGETVSWTVPVGDFLGNEKTELTVTYEAPKA